MTKLAVLCFGIDEIFNNKDNTKEHTILSFLKELLKHDVKIICIVRNKNKNDNSWNTFWNTDNIVYCSSPNVFLELDLDKRLKKHGITHIIILGKMYPMTMESTSYNAYFSGFQVIGLEDMVISETEENIQDFFVWFNMYFGITYTSDDLFNAIDSGDIYEVKDVEIP